MMMESDHPLSTSTASTSSAIALDTVNGMSMNNNDEQWDEEKMEFYDPIKRLKFGTSMTTYTSRIVIDRPRQFARDRLSSHIRYRITRYSKNGKYRLQVHRRFSDWVALYDMLESSIPDAIIPPVPTKNSLSLSAAPAFLYFRARQLQSWINVVFESEKLSASHDFYVFATAPTETWEEHLQKFVKSASRKALGMPASLSSSSAAVTGGAANGTATVSGDGSSSPPSKFSVASIFSSLAGVASAPPARQPMANDAANSDLLVDTTRYSDFEYSKHDEIPSEREHGNTNLGWTSLLEFAKSTFVGGSPPSDSESSASTAATAASSSTPFGFFSKSSNLYPSRNLSKSIGNLSTLCECIRSGFEDISNETGELRTALHSLQQFEVEKDRENGEAFSAVLEHFTKEYLENDQKLAGNAAANLFGESGLSLHDQGASQMLSSAAMLAEGMELARRRIHDSTSIPIEERGKAARTVEEECVRIEKTISDMVVLSIANAAGVRLKVAGERIAASRKVKEVLHTPPAIVAGVSAASDEVRVPSRNGKDKPAKQTKSLQQPVQQQQVQAPVQTQEKPQEKKKSVKGGKNKLNGQNAKPD